ncbi:MAG: Hsp20/alpha crystallin family protein [Polyangiaceae bacterium]
MANLIRKRHASPSSIWRDADLTTLFEDLFTPSMSTAAFVPSIELMETDSEYSISAELPGLSENDVDVQVDDNNVLTIRGEKKSEVRESRGGTEFSERAYGEFVRAIQLPPTIDASHIDATYENGVLRLRVPKVAETRARKIPIGKEGKEEKKEEQEKVMVSENPPAQAQEGNGHPVQPSHH